MAKLGFRRNNRGQVLIVSALLVSVLLLSTALYVIEVGKEAPKAEATTESGDYSGYRQNVRNALVSALANVTGGGDPAVLDTDLSTLETAVAAHSYQALVNLNYTKQNTGNYDNGLYIWQGDNGQGVSSACVTFNFDSQSPSYASTAAFTLTVTSTVTVAGSLQQINDTQTKVTLTVNVQNDGAPASAQTLSFSYLNDADWVRVNAYNVTSSGVGSYTVMFNAQTQSSADPLTVALTCVDQRGISVGANLTCDT